MFMDLHVETQVKDWEGARASGAGGSSGSGGGSAAGGELPSLLPQPPLQKTMLQLLELGYDGFAVSVAIEGGRLHRFKPFRVDFGEVRQQAEARGLLDGRRAPQSQCLRPYDPTVDVSDGFFHPLRLTIETSSMEHLVHLTPTSMLCKFFDIIAVKPGSQEEFAHLCHESQSVDVICIDTQGRLPFDLKLKDVDAAVARGLCFEVCVATALRDPQSRRHLIANGSKLVRLTRGGRHVMLNSGAADVLECRAPHDLANLGMLMGMTFEHSRNAVGAVWRRAIEHGAKRRSQQTGVTVTVS